jgi:hypothetical protein
VQEIANDILTEQTPKKLLEVRGKVYELLVNVVPPELIIRQLAAELMKKLDDEVKHEVRCCPHRPAFCATQCSKAARAKMHQHSQHSWQRHFALLYMTRVDRGPALSHCGDASTCFGVEDSLVGGRKSTLLCRL